MISMERYTSDVFAPLVGQVFCFYRSADTREPAVRLELLEVQASAHRADVEERQPFSLLFALRDGEPTVESTLHLRHDSFEPCAWFVNRVAVPGRDSKTPYYEAVFG